jgi:CRISPR-associated protein Cas5t
MGIKTDTSQEYQSLFSGLSAAVYGRFESIVKDYTWFRNLSKESHISKFQTTTNRIHDFTPQHPGGQMQVFVESLNENRVLVYFSHCDNQKLLEIEECFRNPEKRSGTFHLGRAEDWLVIEDIRQITPEEKDVRRCRLFAWLPEPSYCDESYIKGTLSQYETFFNKAPGNCLRMPLFYRITEDNERIFETYYTAKLYEGGVFPETCTFLMDRLDDETELPLIFTKVRLQHGI